VFIGESFTYGLPKFLGNSVYSDTGTLATATSATCVNKTLDSNAVTLLLATLAFVHHL
jgi:hypothetical protein